jgi:NADH-quinone oxidoreductase subunit J
MDFKTFIFYIFAATLIFAALRVITARNPVHSALFLALSFFTAAALWLLLRAEFLAITLVLVYVGAVMVLFLFVVMMLDINFDKLREGFWSYLPLAVTVGLVMVFEMGLVLAGKKFGLMDLAAPADRGAGYSNTKELGRLIYTDYVYPFELASVILLVAIVAAIALTLRRRKATKYQNPSEQVRVRRQDRIRIVPMVTEGRSQESEVRSQKSAKTGR